jgi:2-keto-3-deoxy-L-rhamnonate aldolase RhmA
MGQNFRDLLKGRSLLFGTMVTISSLELAEIMADAGFDWLFIDLEHSTLGIREAQAVIQAVGSRVAGVLRLPLNDEIWIKKALDIGPAGIIIPQVNSPQEARQAVQWSKYPPEGRRSVGLGRASGYGANFQPYVEQANQQTALIIQAEHIEAVRHIDEILCVEGLDGVLVGPYDLSASMNRTGQVKDPEVQAAVDIVRKACQKRKVPVGIFAATIETAVQYRREGYTLIAAGSDALLAANAARDMRARWNGETTPGHQIFMTKGEQ